MRRFLAAALAAITSVAGALSLFAVFGHTPNKAPHEEPGLSLGRSAGKGHAWIVPDFEAKIYSAAVRKALAEETGFGPDAKFPVIHLRRTTDDNVFRGALELPEKGWVREFPRGDFSGRSRALPESVVLSLAGLGVPINLVESKKEVITEGADTRVINDGVFVSVSNVWRTEDGGLRVGAHTYLGHLLSTWSIYKIEVARGRVLLERVGPYAIL